MRRRPDRTLVITISDLDLLPPEVLYEMGEVEMLHWLIGEDHYERVEIDEDRAKGVWTLSVWDADWPKGWVV